MLPNRARYSAKTCMLVGLYYMHISVTQDQVAVFIGITCQPNVSRLISFFLDHLISHFEHLIALDPDDSLRMRAPYVDMFKRKLRMYHVEGVDSRRYNDVIGFVDGKLHRIARPMQRAEHTAIGVDTQRTVYSGYKKVHAVTFQAVVVPNGLIVQLCGGFSGCEMKKLVLFFNSDRTLEQNWAPILLECFVRISGFSCDFCSIASTSKNIQKARIAFSLSQRPLTGLPRLLMMGSPRGGRQSE